MNRIGKDSSEHLGFINPVHLVNPVKIKLYFVCDIF